MPRANLPATVRDEQPAAFDSGIEFAGPFPANASLSLSCRKSLVDDKGRTLVNAARFPAAFESANCRR
jgi:hypothetical protein